MNDSELDRIRAHLFWREVTRGRNLLENPFPFLEEIDGYLDEPSDEVLRNVLGDEIHQKRIWGSILLLSGLRERRDPRWTVCEPVIRRFWNRVEDSVFSNNFPLKEQYYQHIFGEENERTPTT